MWKQNINEEANENIITIGLEITRQFMKNSVSSVGQEELKLPFHILLECGNQRDNFLTWSLISSSQNDGVEFMYIPRVMGHRVFGIAQICWYQEKNQSKKNKFCTGQCPGAFPESKYLFQEFKLKQLNIKVKKMNGGTHVESEEIQNNFKKRAV